MSLCIRCTTLLLPVPPGSLRKILYSFWFFFMFYCIYEALAPCSVVHYYMALISVQVAYMSTIVLKIHILPFCPFCMQHTHCISCISGVVMTHCIYGIFFFLLLILQCVETLDICCSIILCNIWVTISHADCGILFSKSWRSTSNATQFSLIFFAFWCMISRLDMYESW